MPFNARELGQPSLAALKAPFGKKALPIGEHIANGLGIAIGVITTVLLSPTYHQLHLTRHQLCRFAACTESPTNRPCLFNLEHDSVEILN